MTTKPRRVSGKKGKTRQAQPKPAMKRRMLTFLLEHPSGREGSLPRWEAISAFKVLGKEGTLYPKCETVVLHLVTPLQNDNQGFCKIQKIEVKMCNSIYGKISV